MKNLNATWKVLFQIRKCSVKTILLFLSTTIVTIMHITLLNHLKMFISFILFFFPDWWIVLKVKLSEDRTFYLVSKLYKNLEECKVRLKMYVQNSKCTFFPVVCTY